MTRCLSYVILSTALLTSCGGGGGGNHQDSGLSQTYLSVQASDVDGETLHYQWRVTGGTVDNRDSSQTVWTMPDGPGLHFAYVTVSDGRGGYAVQQYSVATDNLGTSAPVKAAVSHASPTAASGFVDATGSAYRLRFRFAGPSAFAVPGGNGATASRIVYEPDIPVQVLDGAAVVYSGSTDLSGEVSLPKLDVGKTYTVKCAASPDLALSDCGFSSSLQVDTHGQAIPVDTPTTPARNLQLFGHVALADGGICGNDSEFFNVQSAATVQLQQADGTAIGAARRVNRFGDYALDASVAVRASLQLLIQCESLQQVVAVGHPKDSSGAVVDYTSAQPVEVSYQIPNSRPRIVKMVANGADGNVRGQMVVLAAADATSNGLPGTDQFLTYKGRDTRLSACRYYRALGAAGDCDAQGNLVDPISFDDWLRQRQLTPYKGNNAEVSAKYVNRMDLNLVRRMTATQVDANNIAFYVCNHPGPVGTTQVEVDQVIDTGLADQKRVACVAMEWTTSPNVNGGKPFTKFLTFGPDGSLLPSINLDGRGEKYMPGACIACHGGTQYSGRFPESGNPSPNIGSGFLPFDTGNYRFSTNTALTEPAQTEAFYQLNRLVQATEINNTRPSSDGSASTQASATSQLIDGWYASGSHALDKSYLPPAWAQLAGSDQYRADAARLYRGVVGMSCRTCHASMPSPRFDWDSNPTALLNPDVNGVPHQHVCGGTADVALNASMPNALVSRDQVSAQVSADPELTRVMTAFFGCSAPLPDPAYAKR